MRQPSAISPTSSWAKSWTHSLQLPFGSSPWKALGKSRRAGRHRAGIQSSAVPGPVPPELKLSIPL